MSVFFGERTSADDRGCFSSPRSGSSAPRHADARARVGEERDALFGIHGGRKPCWRVGSWRNGGREERGAQAKEGKKKVKSRAVKISSCFRSTSCSPFKKKNAAGFRCRPAPRRRRAPKRRRAPSKPPVMLWSLSASSWRRFAWAGEQERRLSPRNPMGTIGGTQGR